jgi:hypothetical protein
MLGTSAIEDETSPPKKKSTSSMTNLSVSTVSAAAQHKIEEEIIAEEIRLAQAQQQYSAKKKFGSKRRSSDMNADMDMIEDFNNEFDDEMENKDDAIVDEVEEEDALRMIDEEIMNTAIGKTDARKIKDLIHKIDGGAPRSDHFTQESKSADAVNSSNFSNKSKPVDQ